MTIYSISAYVYKITCIPTQQFYHGYREANITENRTPEEDLWKYYFTSSEIIAELIKKYGTESFLVEIVYRDTEPLNAYWQEQRNIKNDWNNTLLLNGHFIDPDSGNKAWRATPDGIAKGVKTRRTRGTDKIGVEKMIDTKRKNGTAKIGSAKAIKTQRDSGKLVERQNKIAANKRKNGTDKVGAAKAIETQRKNGTLTTRGSKMIATKMKMGITKSSAAKGIETMRANGTLSSRAKNGVETRIKNGTEAVRIQKHADAISKDWEIISPNNEIFVIRNLSKFCRDNDLDKSKMFSAAGTDRSYNGWKCKRV